MADADSLGGDRVQLIGKLRVEHEYLHRPWDRIPGPVFFATGPRSRNVQLGMKIVVNGQAREVPEGTSVESLVAELGLSNAACAAEVNKKLVAKRERASVTLREGDVIEVVTLVGGG